MSPLTTVTYISPLGVEVILCQFLFPAFCAIKLSRPIFSKNIVPEAFVKSFQKETFSVENIWPKLPL